MDIGNLSEADKHLLYGLLLKKRRGFAQERSIAAIMRGPLDLDQKIEAIMRLAEEGAQSRQQPAKRSAASTRGGRRGTGASAAGRRRANALVVDVHPDITKLLKKCSLKRRLTFERIGESFDAVHLLRKLRTKVIIVNENLSDEDYVRYFEICRAIEAKIKIIYLGAAPRGLQAGPFFHRSTRFVPKPINIADLEKSARELLGSGY